MQRILIIDDQEAIRQLCRTALQADGFEALAVPSGAQALKFLRVYPVDLVLTDVVMPDIDGIQLIQEMRKRIPGIPVVAMSGGGVLDADECLRFAQEIGADVVLRKPFEMSEMVRVIKEQLGQQTA